MRMNDRFRSTVLLFDFNSYVEKYVKTPFAVCKPGDATERLFNANGNRTSSVIDDGVTNSA